MNIQFLESHALWSVFCHFSQERFNIFARRVSGAPEPWTDDLILQKYSFTNTYRASDRTSQYLIRHVIYGGSQEPEELVFRIMLFKLFNKIETWQALVQEVGTPSIQNFSVKKYGRVLSELIKMQKIYNSAYIITPPRLGDKEKHVNQLNMFQRMMNEGLLRKIVVSKSLEEVYRHIRAYPYLGDFLAFQLAIDINYSTAVNFSEMDFIVPGVGALRGLKKVFPDVAPAQYIDVLRSIAETSPRWFKRTLWGHPLQLIDVQNLFCEIDKYTRVSHPEVGKPARIKRNFTPHKQVEPHYYPPKWRLDTSRPLGEFCAFS